MKSVPGWASRWTVHRSTDDDISTQSHIINPWSRSIILTLQLEIFKINSESSSTIDGLTEDDISIQIHKFSSRSKPTVDWSQLNHKINPSKISTPIWHCSFSSTFQLKIIKSIFHKISPRMEFQTIKTHPLHWCQSNDHVTPLMVHQCYLMMIVNCWRSTADDFSRMRSFNVDKKIDNWINLK